MIWAMPSRDNRIENDRIARRAARLAAEAEDLYIPPPDSECEVDVAEYPLSKGHKIHVTLVMKDRRLVRFFIAWMALDRDGEWSERYSVCTRHGHLHEHVTGHHRPNDGVNIEPLRSQADVETSHDLAYDRVHNRYIFAVGNA